MKRGRQGPPKQQGRAGRPLNSLAAVHTEALALYTAGRFQEALALCTRKLLPFAARNPDVLTLIGVLHYCLKDFANAESFLKRAVAAGGKEDSHLNLALVYTETKQDDEAEKYYRRVLELNPRQAKSLNNLGNILTKSQKPEKLKEALECYEKALAADPNYASAYANKGVLLEKLKQSDAAESCFRQAIALSPSYEPALISLANLLKTTRRLDDALKIYEQAFVLAPNNRQVLDGLFATRLELADWNPQSGPRIDTLIAALNTNNEEGWSPLYMLALPEMSAKQQRLIARNFGHNGWKQQLAKPPLASLPATPISGRMRIGYLSADFRDHAVSYLISEVIASHDKQHHEIFLYSYGPPSDSALRHYLEEAADHFIILNELDDEEAAKRIKADGIDALIDLTGYTTHARLGINALRPAPVIASWIGYVGSLGEPRLADYIIGDPIATPPELAPNFSETLALMPECFQPNCALSPLPPTPSHQAEDLPEDKIVYCSLNQIFKLNPQLWDDWCQILQAVPNSVLWLSPIKSPTIEKNLRLETERRGVSPERIIFAQKKPLEQHRARLQLADIALDTFPYNSGSTASDVLRAGVPLVTRMGDTFVSRMAGSLMHAVGLPELVSSTREGYVEQAILLGQNEGYRRTVRKKLAKQLPASPVFQPQRTARQLEALLRAMHEQATTGRREIIQLNPTDWQ